MAISLFHEQEFDCWAVDFPDEFTEQGKIKYGAGLTAEKLTRIYTNEFTRIVRYVVVHLECSWEQAEDIVQEAFFALWRKLSEYEQAAVSIGIVYGFVKTVMGKVEYRREGANSRSLEWYEQLRSHHLQATLERERQPYHYCKSDRTAEIEQVVARIRESDDWRKVVKQLGYRTRHLFAVRQTGQQRRERARREGWACATCGATECGFATQMMCHSCYKKLRVEQQQARGLRCRQCGRADLPMDRKELCHRCYMQLYESLQFCRIRGGMKDVVTSKQQPHVPVVVRELQQVG